jgi:di/tricarboxylate transporter
MVLLGIIMITAPFSKFMSNTATTAVMVVILTPLFAHLEGRNPLKKAMRAAGAESKNSLPKGLRHSEITGCCHILGDIELKRKKGTH